MALDFPNNPSNGDQFSGPTKSWTYSSAISAWESTSNTVVNPTRTVLTGNGVLSAFSIGGADNLTNPSALIVSIDGAVQNPVQDYSVANSVITFTSPLPNGSVAVVVSPTNTIQVSNVVPSDGSVTSAKLANDISIAGTLTVGGATNVAGLSASGQVQLTGQSATNSNSAMTMGLNDSRYLGQHQFRTRLDTFSSWTTVTSGTGTSISYGHGSIALGSSTPSNFGAITANPVFAARFNIGEFAGNGYGGIDFGKRIEITFGLTTVFNFDVTKQSFAVVLSNATGTAGLSSMLPSSGANYIAMVCSVGGAVTLQVCNNTTKTTSSTLTTLGSNVNNKLFRIVNLGNGTVELYMNNILLGNVTGGSTTQVATNNPKFYLCTESNAASVTINGFVAFFSPEISWTP